MQWTTDEILQTFCRTFLHSLWQGTIAATAAGLLLLLTRRTNPRIRYNMLGGILLLFVLSTIITFCYELPTATSEIPEIIGLMAMPALPMQWDEVMFQYLDQHAMPIFVVWMLIFLFKCIRLTGGFMQIRRIRRNAHPANDHWQQQVQALLQQLGIKQHVALLESAMVKVPMTLGTLKPCIYIPAGLLLQLPADQVEAIFLHELAHIRRKDYLVNILQSFAETVFFFNPPLLWISARIREEREACCDDIVLAHTARSTYVEALLAFQEGSLQPQLGMALQGRHHYLYNRVKRMLTRENQKLSIMEKTMLITGLIAVTAFSLMPGLEQPAIAAPILVQKETPQTEKVTLQPPVIHFAEKSNIVDTLPPPPPKEERFITISSTTQDEIVFVAKPQELEKVVFESTDTQPGNKVIFKAQPSNTTTPKEIRFEEKMNDSGKAKEIRFEEKMNASGKTKTIKFEDKVMVSGKAKEIKFEDKMTLAGKGKEIKFEDKMTPSGKTKAIKFEDKMTPAGKAKEIKFEAKAATTQEPKPDPKVVKFPAPKAKPAPAAEKKDVQFPKPAQQPKKKTERDLPDEAIFIKAKGQYQFLEWKENGKLMHAELSKFRKNPSLQASLKSSMGEKKFEELIRDMPILSDSSSTRKVSFPAPKVKKQNGPNGIPAALYKNMNISKPQHC